MFVAGEGGLDVPSRRSGTEPVSAVDVGDPAPQVENLGAQLVIDVVDPFASRAGEHGGGRFAGEILGVAAVATDADPLTIRGVLGDHVVPAGLGPTGEDQRELLLGRPIVGRHRVRGMRPEPWVPVHRDPPQRVLSRRPAQQQPVG